MTHKVHASNPPIMVLALVPEHAVIMVVIAADVVDGTMVANVVGGIVVLSRAADSPADIDHGLARGLPPYLPYPPTSLSGLVHVLVVWPDCP